MMKRFLLCGVLLSLVLLLAACASPFSEYENFHDDLDISVRIEDALRGAENGAQDAFYRDTLNTLMDDLQNCRIQTKEAQEVNTLYTKCVQALLDATDARKAGEELIADELTEEAVLYYQEGNMRYQDFMTEYSAIKE